MVAIGYKDKFQSDVLDKLTLDAVPTYTDLKVKQGHRLAPHPLFEYDHGDASIRTAIMVGLGCDTHPTGCKDMGAPTLRTVIEKLEEHEGLSEESLCKFYATKAGGWTEGHLKLFSQSARYEPGNITTDDDVPRFIHDSPVTLGEYNKEFIMGETGIGIDNSIQRCMCCGPVDSGHA